MMIIVDCLVACFVGGATNVYIALALFFSDEASSRSLGGFSVMPALLHPGVYVMEVPSGLRLIEGATTSTTIFVGETERGPIGPTKIRGRVEYQRLFGGYMQHMEAEPTPRRVLLPYAIDGFFANGGTMAYVLRLLPTPATTSKAVGKAPMAAITDAILAASPGIWSERVNILRCLSSDGVKNRFRVVVRYKDPGTDKYAVVEDWDRLSLESDDENYAVDVLKRSSFVRWNEEASDAPDNLDTSDTGTMDFAWASGATQPTEDDLANFSIGTNLAGGVGGGSYAEDSDVVDSLELLNEIDDAALLVNATSVHFNPAASDDDFVIRTNQFIGYAERRPLLDLFAVADLPRLTDGGIDPVTAAVARAPGMSGTRLTSSTFAGAYWPWAKVPDPVGAGSNPDIAIPPSGHVAGLFARTDRRRGVWKAPAGVDAAVLGTRALDYRVLDIHQDDLNPKGINAIRGVPTAGSVVWGARTLKPSSEWRYVPVRRTAIYLRKSIYNGIQWAVFEPNGAPLWQSLRQTIAAFMETQFRNGAFAGRTSREAYFVKCDAETTTEADQAAGVVNILVGFAPFRPAEFVVVKLSQKAGQTGA